MRLTNMIPLMIFAIIIAALYMSFVPEEDNSQQLKQLKLHLVSGETLELDSLQGRPYIIRLFSSWCSICRKDGPALKELSKRMNAPIVGIAVQDTIENVKKLNIESLPYDYIAIDSDDEVKKIFKNKAVPETIFVNEDGVITLRRLGALK